MFHLLSLETSCDDTSVALLQSAHDCTSPYKLLFLESFSQEYMLRQWGGVVPEIAARNHLDKIFPLIKSALQENHLTYKDINAIAVTQGPGLLGPLLTGINTAKALSLAYKIPLIGVNHLFAHLEAIHYDQKVQYPYIGCVISGGHTFFSLVESSHQWKLLGSTTDDALGEALDKGGKILGLPYPAGKYLDQLSSFGNPKSHNFPKPMAFDKTSCKISYSGLKNSLRLFIDKNPDTLKLKPQNFSSYFKESAPYYDIVSSYMNACLDALIDKIPSAYNMAKTFHPNISSNTPIVFGGGVAMSKTLHAKLEKLTFQSYCVSPLLCTDNALMIGHWAWKNFFLKKDFPNSLTLDAYSRYLDRKLQSWVTE